MSAIEAASQQLAVARAADISYKIQQNNQELSTLKSSGANLAEIHKKEEGIIASNLALETQAKIAEAESKKLNYLA